MMLLTLSLSALASPVRDAVQAKIFPSGYAFVSDALSGTTWPVGPTDYTTTWECYDTLTVQDLNVSLGLQQVSLTPTEEGIGLVGVFGEVRGEDMRLIGTSGWLDACIDFNAGLNYIELIDGYVTGELAAKVDDRALQLHFPESPVLEGEIESDLVNFPDELAWLVVENAALKAVGNLIENELPAVLTEFTAGGVALPTFGDLEVDITPREIAANPEGLYAAVDVDLGGNGGVGISLDLREREGSHVAVGLPAPLVEEVLFALWQRGLLTSNSDLAAPLVQELLGTLDLGDDVEVFVGVAAPPAVVIDEEGMFLRLSDIKVELNSAAGDPLLSMLADARGWLEAEVRGGAITLSVHELSLEVQELEANSILSRDSANLQAFLEGWVTDLASQALDGISIWESHFEALGYVLRVDETEYQSGGLVAWFTLFDADDPEVDRTAPETLAEAVLNNDEVFASWQGEDDRGGPLMFRYRVDGGAWSRWTVQQEATLPAVEPGSHLFEVVARDGWFNQDLTPAAAQFTVSPTAEEEPRGCGCNQGVSSAGVLGLLGLLLFRRRSR